MNGACPVRKEMVNIYLNDLGLFHHNPQRTSHQETSRYRGPIAYMIFQRGSMVWSSSTCRFCHEASHYVGFNLLGVPSGTDADLLARFRLDKGTIHAIEEYTSRNVLFLYFFVKLVWRDPDDNIQAHAILMVIDTRAKRYGFYDPDESNSQIGIRDTAGGVRYVKVRYLMWHSSLTLIPEYTLYHAPFAFPSLQTVMEEGTSRGGQQDQVPSGLCALLGFLVMICCRRFNTPNAWHLALHIRNMCRDNLRTSNDKMAFCANLVHWWMSMYKGNKPERLARRLGLIRPDDEAFRHCMTVSDRAPNTCKRAPCAGEALCWQHGSMFLNHWPNTGKACKEEIRWRHVRPLPKTHHDTIMDVDT